MLDHLANDSLSKTEGKKYNDMMGVKEKNKNMDGGLLM